MQAGNLQPCMHVSVRPYCLFNMQLSRAAGATLQRCMLFICIIIAPVTPACISNQPLLPLLYAWRGHMALINDVVVVVGCLVTTTGWRPWYVKARTSSSLLIICYAQNTDVHFQRAPLQDLEPVTADPPSISSRCCGLT